MESKLSTELAAIAAALHAEPDVEHTVEAVVRHAPEIAGGDCAGLILVRGCNVDPSSATTPEAEKADQLQLQHGEGPGVMAMASDDAVVVENVAKDPRWPQWSLPTADLGLHSVVSLPLGTGKTPLGALTLYAAEPGGFDRNDVEAARLYARHASVAVTSAYQESGLREAMTARHLIGQAQGILMERHGLTADQAFALLRRSARTHGVKLSERAAQVIHNRKLAEF